jgi:hypothetical protein
MALRSLLLTALAVLLLPAEGNASVRTYPLDARTVYTIRLGRDVPTTCVFPGPISALEGANVGLKPDEAPAVLLSFQPGAAYFSLRAQKDGAGGAMNVIFRGQVFVLSLVCGPDADRSVTFLDEPMVGGERRPATPEVLRGLVKRARHETRLANLFPALASTIERTATRQVTAYRDFTVTIDEVFRFEAEDTLVLALRFENAGDQPARYDARNLAVRVGTEIFPAAFVDATGAIPPRATTRAYVAITGSHNGGRANLSTRETLSVIVPP